LTGHGCYQHYLWKRRRAANPYCMHYEKPEDTVEHTLFNCPFWAEDRPEMEQCIGRTLQLNDVPYIILGPEQELLPDYAFRRRRIKAMAEEQKLVFGRMVEAILGRKENAERARQTRLVFGDCIYGLKAKYLGWLGPHVYIVVMYVVICYGE